MNGIWQWGRRVWRNAHGASPFASHVALTAGTNGVLALLGFVTGVLAARLLGPQGRGELAAIQMWPSFLATLAMLGLPEALVYFSAREPGRSGRYLGTAIGLALLASLPFAAAGYLLMPRLLLAQPAEVIRAAQWYLWLILLYALVGLPYHPLRGQQDFLRWNILRILPSVGWLAVLLLAWVAGWHAAPVLAGAYLVVLAILFFPVMAVVLRRIPGPYTPDLAACRPLLSFGLPSMASSIPQVLNFRLDQMIMAALLPAQALGLYVIGVTWGNMPAPLLSAVSAVALPRIAGIKDPEQRNATVAHLCRFTVLFALVIGAFLFVLTPWILPAVFGRAFASAVPAALVLVAGGTLSGLNLVLDDVLRGLGRPGAVLWAKLGGLIATAGTLAILLPRFGMMGAAWASLLGSGAATLIAAMWTVRVTSVTPMALLVPRLDGLQIGWARLQALMNDLVG